MAGTRGICGTKIILKYTYKALFLQDEPAEDACENADSWKECGEVPPSVSGVLVCVRAKFYAKIKRVSRVVYTTHVAVNQNIVK